MDAEAPHSVDKSEREHVPTIVYTLKVVVPLVTVDVDMAIFPLSMPDVTDPDSNELSDVVG